MTKYLIANSVVERGTPQSVPQLTSFSKFLLSLQVETFLLAHTFGICVRVFRVGRYGEEDFIAHISDESTEHQLPVVDVISEDDRHYNIIV